MFIDELTLHLKAGQGGRGVVRWRHEKGKNYGGPSGGNGGKGGNVYALTVRDIGILSQYRNIKLLEAGRGNDGAKNLKQGATGKDIEIRLPVGSRLTNLVTGYSVELLKDMEKVLLLGGGRGGMGNAHFKSSTNITPRKATLGELGDEADFHIELLLIVDFGIIGLPSSGKSSLLNSLTNADSRVGAFPFTTVEPVLGTFYKLIIADIPGLIEGAAKGKGLGHKFLRHISRAGTLIHCVSAEEPDPLKAFQVVRNELKLYNKEMMKKQEILILTKADVLTNVELHKKLNLLKKVSRHVFAYSILDDNLIRDFRNYLTKSFG